MKSLQNPVIFRTMRAVLACTIILGGASYAFATNPSAGKALAPACGGDAALRNLFKSTPADTKVKDKVELYDEKGLFNYIDGGAPLYIKNHFRKLGASEMVSEKGGELTCDIYDMNGPDNARAMFTSEKSSTSKAVTGWSEAASGPMFFIFHQGYYYASSSNQMDSPGS
jgi:hypothetical protein